MAKTDILFPTGRIVAGSLYKPNTTNAEGGPLVYKNGPNAGQARVDYFFAIAIPKNGQHWAQTEWGAKIWAAGHAFMPQAGNIPSFAWKVTDGDSAVPNKKGKAPNTREGYPGNWVVSLSSSYAPKIYNRDGTQVLTEQDAIKPGYFVQVFGNVDGNNAQNQPGVFLNHSMVALQAYGPEIVFGPDATGVGFGQGALPAGATTTPVGGFNPAPLPVPGAPLPSPPVTVAPPALPVGAVGAPNIAPPPNPAILGAPAPAPVHIMTPAATTTYEAYIQSGWSDALLIHHGLMLP
jgi:hypothetical protein